METLTSGERIRAQYQRVTDTVLGLIDAGVVPWRKPWESGGSGGPRSVASGERYRGGNAVLLAGTACMCGYSSPWWLTYQQAGHRGGHVRAGEHSTPIVHWKWVPRRKDAPAPADGWHDSAAWYAVLSVWSVFNLQQCEGVDVEGLELPAQKPEPERLEAAEMIVRAMPERPGIEHGYSRAAYVPHLDRVEMPHLAAFTSPSAYYSTLFHELTHSTGAEKRLDRAGVCVPHHFGDAVYSEEELIAELGALYLCDEVGLAPAVQDSSAAYLEHWSRKLRDDSRLFLRASSAAARAADYVMRRREA